MQLQGYKPLMRKSEIGYTLIEILVGVTILGLFFSFGFASFRDFSRRQALSGTAKQVQGDLRLAQQQALSGKKPIGEECNSPDVLNSFGFRVVDSTSYSVRANCSGGSVVIKDVTLPSGITISVPSPNPIRFKVLGQGTFITSGETATLTLTQVGTGNQATITVTSGGEIK